MPLDTPLLKLLLVLFVLVSLCVAIHGVGVTLGLHSLGRSWRGQDSNISMSSAFWVLIRVVYGLLLLHLLQILVRAAFYQLDGCFPDFETSFYFSATSYSTVGYGDVILPRAWRVLGSVEGVTGVLMFGWSTGVLFMIAEHTHGRITRSNDGPHRSADGQHRSADGSGERARATVSRRHGTCIRAHCRDARTR